MSVRRLLDPSAATVRCRLKSIGENVWQVWAGDELLGSIQHLDRACWAALNPDGVRVTAVMARSKFWAINRLKADRDRRMFEEAVG